MLDQDGKEVEVTIGAETQEALEPQIREKRRKWPVVAYLIKDPKGKIVVNKDLRLHA